MSNIIGEEIEGYVASQINARQILHGSGANAERNTNQLNVLNSQTSWIKLASGVSVSSSRLKEIDVDTSFHGMGLAKNNVLFGGTSKVANNRTVQRDGLQPQNPNSSYTYGEFGYVPMAGITGASIKTLNRGSLKKASVKLKVHDREQFEIIDLLYLRLGYTVLLEWGNSIFTPDGYSKEIVRDTLIDSGNGFFNSGFSSGRSYLDILPQIENYRTKWRGNYDGLLGKVSNFDWSFNEDGSYDINLTIISLGDVIESLKTNISVDKDSSEFLKILEENPEKTTDPPEEDPIEDNKDSNAIAFMLWAWKYTNKEILTDSSKTISIKTPDESHYVSQFLVSSEELSTTEITYEFTVKASYYEEGQWRSETTVDSKSFTKDDTLYDEVQKEKKKLESVASNSEQKIVTYKKIKKTTSTTQSPIAEFGAKDAFAFLVKNEQYYLRFGALLEFLVDKIVPIIDSKPKQESIFNIDIEQYYNWMYSVPNQISLDPRVCIIRNSNFVGSGGAKVEIYDQLLPFRAQDYVTDSPNLNKAYIMNIYLNFNFILDSLNSNADERGNVNLYNFIVSLCDGVSKALGGVNTLEPIIDETSNTLKIVDTTPIPGVTKDKSSAYTLQLYGYDGVSAGRSRSNFIRKIDLKTAITPEYATMITVGATAGGYVKGTEATAFSRWNAGLTDRFKEEILPSNPTSQKSNLGGVDEAETNYVTKFLDKYNGKHGIKGNLYGGGSISKCELSSDIIDSNISIVTEYYKFQQSQNKEGGGGTVGFIPFKLGLTMDGLAGIKIYNKLHVNTRFLPSNYGKTLDLIVTGVSHELNGNDWETQIEATVIPKTTESKGIAITIENIKEDIQAVGAAVNMNDAPLGANPPKSGWIITHTKYPTGTTKGNNIDLIIDVFKEYKVTNPYAIVGALCVIGKESGWIPQSENLNYSKERLPEVWGAFSKTGKVVTKGNGKNNYNDLAAKYAGDPIKLANFIYGWDGSNPKGMRSKKEALGNLTWGDGYKYRGRGFNQITWKSTYESYTKELGVDFTNSPDKLNDPKNAAKSAILFFKNVFTQGGKKDPITFWNNFTSIDEALIYFAKANSGSIKNTASNAVEKSREKRKYFDIVKK